MQPAQDKVKLWSPDQLGDCQILKDDSDTFH
jgi:hypothetical protein